MSAELKIVSSGKVCMDCKLEKPVCDFPSSGYAGRCKLCKNILKNQQRRLRCENKPGYREKMKATVQRYLATPHGAKKAKEHHFRHTYGVTLDHVTTTLEQQHGLCANRACDQKIVLGAPAAAKNQAVVDHDHRTGQFRGILCAPCNFKLGHIEKDKSLTLGLLEYAGKHEAIHSAVKCHPSSEGMMRNVNECGAVAGRLGSSG